MSVDATFWAGRAVCVTGGTGFLGYHLVRRLLDLGAAVRVLALAPRPNHPLRQQAAVDLLSGDICDREQVRRALRGCDVVFHTAGFVSMWGPGLQRLWPVHVEGTRIVLESAPDGARIVHTSSIMAVGAVRSAALLDEESSFNLGGLKVPYCHAKRAAEELALASGRDVVVTNPGFLLGPEDYGPSAMGRYCKRFLKGRLPLAPPGGINLVDVRDAVDGHLLAAEHGRSGRRYILGGENHTFAAFMAALAGAAGYAPRALPRLPFWALAATAGLSELRAWFTGIEPYLALGHLHLNRFHWFYRSDRASAELGFRSRPLTTTLADTMRWFRERKPLKLRVFNRWWMRPQAA